MQNLFFLLIKYRYVILFPLAVVEGPIITIITGFLCSTGFFKLFIVYPIVIVGDNIGDFLYYSLGRWGSSDFLERFGRWIGVTPAKMDAVKDYISINPNKTIGFSKIILGIGVAGLVLAGKSRVPFGRFFKICFLTSVAQSAVYLGTGWFFGTFYLQISHYLNYFASFSIVITLALVLFFIIKSRIRKSKIKKP